MREGRALIAPYRATYIRVFSVAALIVNNLCGRRLKCLLKVTAGMWWILRVNTSFLAPLAWKYFSDAPHCYPSKAAMMVR